MSELNRVVITGMGAISASGHTIDDTWESLLEGRQGLSEIKHWDLGSWSHHLGGEVKDFEPAKNLPDRKLLKVISKQDVLGINAAMQAVQHSGLLGYRDTLENADEFNEQTAVFVGSPGNKYYQQYDFLPLLAKTNGDMKAFAEQLFAEVHPMWLLRILPNNVLAYTGITYGFKGINHNITNHAVSGTQAIIEAFHAIQRGQAKRAIIVAYDVGTDPQSLFYYAKLGLTSPNDLKPFDSEQDGTVLAEGAAAIVLESLDSARERGAKCYAEVIGGMAQSEAKGLVSIEDNGESLAKMINNVLAGQDIKPSELGLVVAHGNGNAKSDQSEARAIKAVVNGANTPVTAFKWSMGHTLCASGILDAALMAKSMALETIPGVANLTTIAEGCEGIHLSAKAQSFDVTKPYALMINRGFASMNACLVLKRYE